MNRTLKLLLGALFVSNLLAGCAASTQPNPQYSELDTCIRSGGQWRSGSCEQASAGGGGGY